MNRIIEDVQTYAREARDFTKSPAAKEAERALHAVHPAIPSLVERISEVLEKVDIHVGDSVTTSRRLADAVVSEVIHEGGGRIGNTQHSEISRRALRNVLVQEAAGHELTMRAGRDVTRDVELDNSQSHGEAAMRTLEAQKVNVTSVFGRLEESDLRLTASGSYDRLSSSGRELVSEAMGRTDADNLNHQQIELNRMISPVTLGAKPVMIAPRRLNRPAFVATQSTQTRQPTFGRRIAHTTEMARMTANQSR